jgi:hypothetical protein
MKKIVLVCFFLCLGFTHLSAQIVINELDSDSDGIDDKEFVELKSQQANFSLDGYVLVMFNGSFSGQDQSYFSLDLSNYQTDENGILLIGSTFVRPFPQLLIAPNTIQNGADAVAVYQGSEFDFPEFTPATTINLVDALVYGTGDADATSLLNALNLSQQIDEDLNGQKDFESIQRNADGSYFVGNPTPRMTNDGSGILQTPVEITVESKKYDEGETFAIGFSTESPVSQNLSFSFSLENNGFNFSDFYGSTNITIQAGESSETVFISLIDDNDDEGDEQMLVRFDNLPQGFIPLNSQVLIRVVDNDFTMSDFGAPTNPTFDIVERTGPAGYYNSLDETSGQELRDSLQAIIAEEGVVRAQTYSDVITIVKKADQNPLNSNQVWLVYTEEGLPKLDLQSITDRDSVWNREHTFPRSRGGFFSIEEDGIADGKDIFWNTNADSLRHGNSDAHGLRAALSNENSSRSNHYYGDYNGPDGNLGSFKGDVARSVFFMAIRYNDLSVEPGFPEMEGVMGDLDTLLAWHQQDPPDDFEMNRNNTVYNWQKNRNPFIDQPELVDYIWGDQTGDTWQQELSNEAADELMFSLYPNPNSGGFYIDGIKNRSDISVFSLTGKKIAERQNISSHQKINLNLSPGVYLIKVTSENKTAVRKMIVK